MTILNLNSELVVLEATGTDSATYLQGQLTNDIRELSEKKFQLSAHLNNKGRIIATFIITSPEPDKYYLITSKSSLDKILPRLKMFILRSKVVLTEFIGNIYLSNDPLEDSVNLEITAGKFLSISAAVAVSITDSSKWHKFLVDNSLPMIYVQSQEKIIPQQINWEILGGVNFKKGCYTGQEIVARTHYLGKVKRRLAKFSTVGVPQIGQTVVSPNLDNQEIGFVVDFYEENSQYIGLASIQLDCIDSLYLDSENQYKLNCTLSHQE